MRDWLLKSPEFSQFGWLENMKKLSSWKNKIGSSPINKLIKHKRCDATSTVLRSSKRYDVLKGTWRSLTRQPKVCYFKGHVDKHTQYKQSRPRRGFSTWGSEKKIKWLGMLINYWSNTSIAKVNLPFRISQSGDGWLR